MKLSHGLTETRNVRFTLNLTGEGTEDDPYIISGDLFPGYWVVRGKFLSRTSFFNFSDSNKPLRIENTLLYELNLGDCSNITISNSRISKLELRDCSQITIKDCTIMKQVNFIKSQSITIDTCEIKRVGYGYQIQDILFSNCHIQRITEDMRERVLLRDSEILKG
jgi:hypothetical protein